MGSSPGPCRSAPCLWAWVHLAGPWQSLQGRKAWLSVMVPTINWLCDLARVPDLSEVAPSSVKGGGCDTVTKSHSRLWGSTETPGTKHPALGVTCSRLSHHSGPCSLPVLVPCDLPACGLSLCCSSVGASQ